MSRIHTLVLVVTTAALAGSAALSAAAEAASPIPEDWPDWLRAQMQQEVKVAAGETLEFEGSGASLTLPGPLVGELMRSDDAEWQWSVRMGESQPVWCWATAEGRDSGVFTRQHGEIEIEGLVEANGSEQGRSLYRLDVTQVSGVPIQHLEWLVSVGSTKKAALALVKIKTAAWSDFTMSCSHSNLGFRDSFDEMFDMMVATARVPAAAAPFYSALHIVNIGAQPVGFVATRFGFGDDGEMELSEESSLMIPVDGALTTMDSGRYSYSTPDGLLTHDILAEAENGELVTDLTLARGESSWEMSGTLQGKEVQATLDFGAAPVSELGQLRRLQAYVASGEKAPESFTLWAPDVDPMRFSEAQYTRTGESQVQVGIGQVRTLAELNDNGNLQTGTINAGSIEFQMTLVSESGSITPE